MTDNWRAQAACKGMGHLFFDKTLPKSRPSQREEYPHLLWALKLCDECPVRLTCFEEAMANHEVDIWGGTTKTQRKEIRKKRRQRREQV